MSEFEKMKVPELRALAEKLGIEGFEDMRKAELVEAIEKMPKLEPEDLHPPTQVGIDEKSSSFQEDFAKHPKFDKFK